MMDQIQNEISFVRFYLDDVVVFSATLGEHVQHTEKATKLIASQGLKTELSKCGCAQGTKLRFRDMW